MNSYFWIGYGCGVGGVLGGQIAHVLTEIVRDHLRFRQIMRASNERMVQEAERFANQGDDV